MLSINTDAPINEILEKVSNMKSNARASAVESIAAGAEMINDFLSSALGDNAKFVSVIGDIDNFTLSIVATGQNDWVYQVYNDIITDAMAQAEEFVTEQFTERMNK